MHELPVEFFHNCMDLLIFFFHCCSIDSLFVTGISTLFSDRYFSDRRTYFSRTWVRKVAGSPLDYPSDWIDWHIHTCTWHEIVLVFGIISVPLGPTTGTRTGLFQQRLWRRVLLCAVWTLTWWSLSFLIILWWTIVVLCKTMAGGGSTVKETPETVCLAQSW